MSYQLRQLRQQLYAWRQRQPLKRIGAVALLLFVWPFELLVHAVLNLFASKRQPKRIVVLQLAGLGDMLMLTPALAALQNSYPNAKIDFITLHGYVKDAFANHPRLNSATALPPFPGQWVISKFANRSGWRLMLATLQCYPTLLLKHSLVRYDLGINFGLSDFDRSLGNALLRLLTVRTTIGSAGLNDQLLTRRVEVNTASTPRVATYLKFLQPLGIAATAQASTYEFPLRQHDLKQVKLMLRSESIDSSRPLVVVHPGGKLHVNSRRWPAEYFVRVCQFLSDHEGFQIVLTGDSDDAQVCETIAQTAGPRVKSIAGHLSFSETAALLSLSQLCITNDTSTLHLADAVQVPRVISIFGPTDPEQLVPRNERHIVFRSKLPCAPCMGGLIDANTERCWREVKEECLSEISPEQVIAVVRQYSERTAVRAARA